MKKWNLKYEDSKADGIVFEPCGEYKTSKSILKQYSVDAGKCVSQDGWYGVVYGGKEIREEVMLLYPFSRRS